MTHYAFPRIGVVGTGFGAAVHVPGWARTRNCEVVAILGRSTKRASEAARRWGVPHWVETMDELLSLRPDIVSMALPPRANEAEAMRLLDKGMPFLCEKPVASSYDRALELANKALQSGVPTAVDFEFLELDTFRALEDLLARSALGVLSTVDITWLNQSWALKHQRPSWKLKSTEGGGVMGMLGSHILYMVEFLFGRIERVSAEGSDLAARSVVGEEAAFDSIHLEMHTSRGVFVQAELSNSKPRLDVHRWIVRGSQGSAEIVSTHAAPSGGSLLTVDTSSGTERVRDQPSNEGDSRIDPFSRFADRFLDALSTGTSFTADLARGARVQMLLETVDTACRAGHEIRPR